jgi:hypothetical protein
VVIKILGGREIREEELVGELEYYVDKYLMALLVFYYWFRCILGSRSCPIIY